MDKKIIVIGNIKPWKKIGNRYRTLSVTGVCATLLSSDYKDPRCVIVKRKKRNEYRSYRLAKPETT